MDKTEKRYLVAKALMAIKTQHKSKITKKKTNNYYIDMTYYSEAIQYVTLTFKGEVEKYLISSNRAFPLENNVLPLQRKNIFSKFTYSHFVSELNKYQFEEVI